MVVNLAGVRRSRRAETEKPILQSYQKPQILDRPGSFETQVSSYLRQTPVNQKNCNKRDFAKYYISDLGLFPNPTQVWHGFWLSIKIFFFFTQLADLVFDLPYRSADRCQDQPLTLIFARRSSVLRAKHPNPQTQKHLYRHKRSSQ
jgi:hypothetical protein